MATDVGMVRPHNEDTAHVDSDGSFFIVADGMGGHAAGEVASAMAVETVRVKLEAARPQIEEFALSPTDSGRRALVQLLQDAVLSAHQAVFQRGSTEEDKNGMGTTLDVLLISGTEAFIAHVGDSRTYLIREGRASQLTTDHTYAEVMVIEGKLTIEEAQVSQLRNILVNAVGVSAEVGVEMAHLELRRDDRLMLCSDGLHDYFPGDVEISERLAGPDAGVGLVSLVELAKSRGGHDNITGIAIHITEITAASPALDNTQPVRSSQPAAGDEERTETTGLPTPDEDDDGTTDADGVANGDVAAAADKKSADKKSADKKSGDKKRRGKRSKNPGPRPKNKTLPSTVAAAIDKKPGDKDEPGFADTLPPTLIKPPTKP